MLVPINITGGTYQSRSLPLSAQNTRNLYPELQETQGTKSSYVLQSFPGYDFFASDVGADATSTLVTADGSADYLLRGAGLTSIADAKVGTFAARIKFASGGDTAMNRIFTIGEDTGGGSNQSLDIFRQSSAGDGIKFRIIGENSAGTDILDNNTTNQWNSADGWLNILFSWDLGNDSVAQMYVNDTDDAAAATTFTDDTINYTNTECGVFTTPLAGGGNLFNGDCAFIWFDPTQKIDFSVEANRRLFFTASGAVASLGDNGETPTGSSPMVYLTGNEASFPTNKGTGGGFTEYGALTDGTLGSGTDRGSFKHRDVLYKVSGTAFYTVSSTGVHTAATGSVLGTDRCIFTGIGDDIVIVTEGKAFLFDKSAGTITEIVDGDLETPNGAATLNNQVIYDGDDARFGVSDVGDATSIDGLNYATAEIAPDDLQRPYVIEGQEVLYLMGTSTIEQWWNSGSGNPPFDRIQAGGIPVGLKALHSVADNGDVMYFLGDDLLVYALSGSSKRPISNISITNSIEGYTTVTDAEGSYFTFQSQGFYQLTFPTEDKSWCYHEKSGQWFEISSGADGGRSLIGSAVNVYNKTIVSDYRNGNLYALNVNTYDENGSSITRIRDTGVLHGGLLGAPGKWIEMKSLKLLAETGVGTLTETPNIMLSWSDDGGRTFSTESWGTINIGTAGNYQKEIEWFGMGGFYERILRFRMTEAVRWSIYSCVADIEIGI